MPHRPKSLSDRPLTLALDDPRGDVLADVLVGARLGNALYRRLVCGAPWGLRADRRDRAVFYLITRGRALLEVDGHAPTTLAAGDVAFLPRGGGHTLRDSAKTTPMRVCDGAPSGTRARRIGGDGAVTHLLAGFCELGGGALPSLLEGLPPLITLSAASGPAIGATVQLIVAELASPGLASALVLQRLADVLLVQALRVRAAEPSCRERGVVALADGPLRRALALIHADVAAPWTVAGLAAKVGLSRSAFAARFTALVGDPPLQYVARWRAARATEMLREGDATIATVAARVGYESVPAFGKAFRRWQGVSPGAWRKRETQPG